MSTLKVGAIQSTTGTAAMTVANTGVITAPNSIIAPGSVLQVQYTQYTGTFSQALTANTNTVLGDAALSVSITPKSTSSIIKLDTHIFHEWGHQDVYGNHVWFFYRDTTKLAIPQAGNRLCGISASLLSYDYDIGSTPEIVSYSYFDAPNTTSQITYKIGILPRYSRTLYVNRTVNDNDNDGHDRGLSFTSATEIGG